MSDEREDAELIRDYCRGDESGFNTLYARYGKMLYGFLNHLIPGNPCEVDEVFEATWLKVIDKLPQYRDDGKFSAWLFRVARNLFIDRVRRSRPGTFLPVDSEEAPDLPDPMPHEPDRSAHNADLGRMIREALDTLPVEQREVFLLREEDLSFKEIAEIQKCSLNTALSRMRYALKSLRSFLSNLDSGGVIK